MADIWKKEPPEGRSCYYKMPGIKTPFIAHLADYGMLIGVGALFGPAIPSPEALAALVDERDALREFYEATERLLYVEAFKSTATANERGRVDIEYQAARARVEAIKPQEKLSALGEALKKADEARKPKPPSRPILFDKPQEGGE